MPGHGLVVPRRPAETLADLHEDEAAALMRIAHRRARAVAAAWAPEGLDLWRSNRAAGGQDCPLSTCMGSRGAGATACRASIPAPRDRLDTLAAQLRAAIAATG